MYKLFLGLMAVVLFVGCSSKEEQALMKSYLENTKYHKFLQKTEKTEFAKGENTVAILTATYMYTPNFEKNDTRDEIFIVGVQFEDSEQQSIYFNADNRKTITNGNEYILRLNDKDAISVVPLSENDKRLEGVSFVADWGKWFTLVFENTLYGKKAMHFSKVAKFTYTKKGF